jgi:hypothetical protein
VTEGDGNNAKLKYDMNEPERVNNGNARHRDGTGTIFFGRPSLAANAGAGIPGKLLRVFEPAELGSAERFPLPAPRARCLLTGLSRTTINELVERKVIRGITVRQPGATRGIKLINKASLLGYLAQLDSEQNGTGEQGAEREAAKNTGAEGREADHG